MIVHTVRIGSQTSEDVSERTHKKIYVGAAETDIQYRDMLVYGRHRWELYSKSAIDFVTVDRKEMNWVQYRSIVEEVIKKADGVMFIVSEHTSNDSNAIWEIECVQANNIPIVGVDVRRTSEGTLPPHLVGRMMKYGWEWFAEFFDGL